ncbi:carbohydrate ABC transporter permease [Glaciibacter superstes]|uniref:carbohydrate ABC transporter permease n=1 Tax=Glaciibacter superstes TaxID=501023 RepID=UPI0003B40B16|nr:carbohydrate ABC transporter permease [Glaciibacter superstes]
MTVIAPRPPVVAGSEGDNSRHGETDAPGRAGRGPSRWLIGAGLLVIVFLQLLPFYVALTTALKERTDLSSQWVFPIADIFFGNFATAIESGNILRAIGNSVIVTVVSTVLVCVLGALAGYPLARRRSVLNTGVSLLNIGLIMIPPLSILVPLYTLLNQMGAVNTYWGVILVMVTAQLPLAIFLYTAFMRSLPISVEEAATMDGASRLQILFRVVFPMLKPVTATVVILTGVAVWNEFALSGYILTAPEMQTIAPAIASFFSVQSNNLPAAAAASLMAVLPVLVAYLFLQKFFIKGLVTGAEK